MKHDPLVRFLGVTSDASAALILGIDPDERDRARILAAREQRLAQVDRHPAHDSEAAAYVRKVIEEATRVLAGRAGVTVARRPAAVTRPSGAALPPPRHPRAPAPPVAPAPPPAPRRPERAAMGPLTTFDRDVLAILIASGGWNATSRARIAAQARRAGVGMAGLLAVMRGLADYSRQGGSRLAPGELASNVHRVAHARARATVAPAHLFSPPREPSPWTTTILAGACGLGTLLVGITVIGLVLGRGTDVPAPVPGPTGGAPVPVVTPPPVSKVVAVGVPAHFDRPPTMQGNAVPARAVEAADVCVLLPGLLEREVEVRLTVAADPDDPAEPLFHAFAAHVDTIATGWVLADASTRAAVLEAVAAVVREAGAPSVMRRLLDELRPAAPTAREPLGLWRGAWRAGALAYLLARSDLDLTTQDELSSMLAVAADTTGGALPGSFAAGARRWLDRAAPELIDVISFDERPDDAWEMWLAALRACDQEDGREASLVSVIRALMSTDLDLGRPGPAVNLLGRLLSEADLTSSGVARDGILALFDANIEITDRDLWVMTSLLATYDAAPWFDPDLIMPDGGGRVFRNRVRDRITSAWPPVLDDAATAETSALSVDQTTAARWLSVAARAGSTAWRTEDSGLLAQLLLAGRVNLAAAYLAAGRQGDAERELAVVERGLDDLSAYVSRLAVGGQERRAGQAVGPDGQWAAAYEEARRNAQDRLQLLRGLRTTAGSDLGPLDAEAFVRVVYRGSTEPIRSLARAVLVDMFATGPVVAMTMLDQFVDAPRSPTISETVRHLTGEILPPARHPDWPAAARLALARHALALRPVSDERVDVLAAAVAEVLAERSALVRRNDRAVPSAGIDLRPPESAALLAAAWRERAATMLLSEAVPVALDQLARRDDTRHRLARHGPQRLVAELLAALDYAAYVAAAERPSAGATVTDRLGAASHDRRSASHVLMQAVEVERAITTVWAVRMGVEP